MSSSNDPHEIKEEVRRYLMVFGALLFLTIVTVGVKYLHLNIVKAIILALIIATIKASLVACYFMHLISERKVVYAVLICTVTFFIGLMFLPAFEHHDVIYGSEYTHPAHPAEEHAEHVH